MTALMQKLLAGSLIAAATLAGIYAVAATAATTLADSFTTEESTRHTRSVEFETAVKRAWAEHKAARAKCGPFTGAKRKTCYAEAKLPSNSPGAGSVRWQTDARADSP